MNKPKINEFTFHVGQTTLHGTSESFSKDLYRTVAPQHGGDNRGVKQSLLQAGQI